MPAFVPVTLPGDAELPTVTVPLSLIDTPCPVPPVTTALPTFTVFPGPDRYTAARFDPETLLTVTGPFTVIIQSVFAETPCEYPADTDTDPS